jgi:hypothetical protein
MSRYHVHPNGQRPRARRKQTRVEELIERAYYASCSGIQINVMDIGKVFAFGREILAESTDYESLKSRLRAFVETIRVDQPEPSCTYSTERDLGDMRAISCD